MRTLNALVGAAMGVAAVISVGAGVAAGAVSDVVGQTYRDAKSTIQSQGSTVVIATRTGGSADIDKCVVTNAWDKPKVSQPRQGSGPNEVLVALSCNAKVAGPGTPGNSAGSPQGRQAITAQQAG